MTISQCCLSFIKQHGGRLVPCNNHNTTGCQKLTSLGFLLFLGAPLALIGGLAWSVESAFYLAGRCCCYTQQHQLPEIDKKTSQNKKR